jgi:hypothetical protein
MLRNIVCIWLFVVATETTMAQQPWHGLERTLRYQPEGNDFVIRNGTRRFTRALYGTNTAFRVEAGDLPEFALYMPGMGGNISFRISANGNTQKLIEASSITAKYRPGSMLYEIRDPMLGNGTLYIAVLAMADREGVIIQVRAEKITAPVQLSCIYGGATGRRFNRDGDMGPDPESSFYLKPEYCTDNRYTITGNAFELRYGSGIPLNQVVTEAAKAKEQSINAIFPTHSNPEIAEVVGPGEVEITAAHVRSVARAPAVNSVIQLQNNHPLYFAFYRPGKTDLLDYNNLPGTFSNAEAYRKKTAGQIVVNTPDPYINTIGPALSIAADAIWESPSYMHGAIGWRMRLNGWRGPYVADVMGWHDRARAHFSSYALSQLTEPATGKVVMDTALHLARHEEKLGNALFSSGYISRNPGGDKRPHHYDMNLVYIDALLWHIRWTGDTAFIRNIWPVIKRHLAWEKRNFDSDDDGLYDAYASIWASDALQYSGGSVTHSSAYNYRANYMAAELAELVGEDAEPFRKEADKIFNAVHKVLWLPSKGVYAEYKDAYTVHDVPAIWTIYHSIDSDLPDAFKAYQLLNYIDTDIPHIPVRAKGFQGNHYTISTSNWMPYTWSLNNVALAELMHTSLANWQSGRKEEAFALWKSSLIESMYLGGSPGNFQQISTYDAIRGEAYRDFADPVAMTARSLVQGLFGILPDALHKKITIRPGFPAAWDHAAFRSPDISMSFIRKGKKDSYSISHTLDTEMRLQLLLNPVYDALVSVTINGKPCRWKTIDSAVALPLIEIDGGKASHYSIEINWKGKPIDTTRLAYTVVQHAKGKPEIHNASEWYDPQKVFSGQGKDAVVGGQAGNRVSFVKIKQGIFTWWKPVHITVKPTVLIDAARTSRPTQLHYEPVDMTGYYNDKVTQIFRNQYLSPRPVTPTLQLPTQGIGDWTHPLLTADINDSGFRKSVNTAGIIKLGNGIPFKTTTDTSAANILFTSQWDNYPKSATVPLSGSAKHLYVLMAGSTNPMQSRIVNGVLIISYTDGNKDTLQLKNPENWWPIEQDYYRDGYAFNTGAAYPVRVHLKTGKVVSAEDGSDQLFNGKNIDGGAATLLDIPLRADKILQSLTVQTLAGDVVIGLMGITLVR